MKATRTVFQETLPLLLAFNVIKEVAVDLRSPNKRWGSLFPKSNCDTPTRTESASLGSICI